MTIEHGFAPILTVTTEDDGSRPRVTAIDWSSSYSESWQKEGMQEIVHMQHPAAVTATDFVDSFVSRGEGTLGAQALGIARDGVDENTGVAIHWQPMILDNGMPGFRVTAGNKSVFIYLNASDNEASVFLYIGIDGDPSQDSAEHHYDLNEELGVGDPS